MRQAGDRRYLKWQWNKEQKMKTGLFMGMPKAKIQAKEFFEKLEFFTMILLADTAIRFCADKGTASVNRYRPFHELLFARNPVMKL